MKNTKIKNLILALLIICISGYVYYYFYLSPQIIKINGIKQEINNEKEKIQKLIDKRPIIDKEIKQAKVESITLNNQIPDQYDSKVSIAYFYNLLKLYNLGSDKISFSSPNKQDSNYKTITTSLKVDGDSQNIKDFIRTIENDKRKYNIRQVTVGQDMNSSSCSLVIDFYAIK